MKKTKSVNEAVGTNGFEGAKTAGGARPGRARRPDLPRSEPERSFAGVFSPAEAKSGHTSEAPNGAPRPAKGRPPGVSDGVTA